MRPPIRISLQPLILAFVLTFVFAHAAAGALETQVNTPEKDLSFFRVMGFDFIDIDSDELLDTPGSPMLPYRVVHFSIPAGFEVTEVHAEALSTLNLGGGYRIVPAQTPVPISHPEMFSFTPPDPSVYSSTEPFPGRLAELVNQGNLSGYRIAAIAVYPLQYTPATGGLRLVTEIEVSLTIAPAALPGERVYIRSENAEKVFRRAALSLAVNKEDVPERAALSAPEGGRADTVDYLIVTDSSYTASFQQLADWKTKKGVPTEVVSTSWVYSNYAGTDNQEKIRNCVKDYWQTKGLVFVLLGGDTSKVPYRTAYAKSGNYGNDLPCDTYFSDLDGTWNDDGDNKWGELFDDNIDAYSDVYVGRAPVDSISQADTFVDKILQYEGHSSMPALPTDYQLNSLMLASWLDGSTNGALLKDKIDDRWIPDHCIVTKLYESLGNLSPSSAVSAMNNGHNFINHDGHGSTSSIQAGTGYLNKSDMQNLTNSPRFSTFYSLSCFSASFNSSDCLGEEFVKNANGGGAYVGNSRYGWYYTGMADRGLSASWDKRFWRGIYSDVWDYWNLAQIHCGAKDSRINKIWTNSTECYCFYELNLLGAVEMPVFKELPVTLDVAHAPTLPVTASTYVVGVGLDGSPVENARICLMKDSDIYEVAFTDAAGFAAFSLDPVATGTLDITVTAHNALPFESTAQVDNGGPCPFITGVDPDWAFSGVGKTITLSGYNFTSTPVISVSFDGVPCGTVTYVDQNTLTCVTPTVMGYGYKEVTVSSSYGSSSLQGVFRFFSNGGNPFNDTPESTADLPVSTPFDIAIGGENLAPYFLMASIGPGPTSTVYGIAGLDQPFYSVSSGTLDNDGCVIETMTTPNYGITFYVHAISKKAAAYAWAEGGNNPNGTGSIEVEVVE